MVDRGAWREAAVLDLTAPVLAIAGDDGSVWSGGLGGVASWEAGSDWSVAPVAVGPVTALTRVGGSVVAGGNGVTYTEDGGTWKMSRIEGGAYPVVDLDGTGETMLAATLGGGVLRSRNAGRTWRPANFGLTDLEVTALRCGGAGALAGTGSGIFRSRDAGRAWRRTHDTDGWAIAALALSGADALAVGDNGALLRSGDGGDRWAEAGRLADGVGPSALWLGAGESVLAGTLAAGLQRSADGGLSWEQVHPAAAFGFSAAAGSVLAATEAGVLSSGDSGESWELHSSPPLHDIARLVVTTTGELFAWGQQAGLVRCLPVPAAVSAPSDPLTAVAPDLAGGLVASGPSGLARSPDDGRTWTPIIPGEAGWVRHITTRADQHGWAISHDGDHILQWGPRPEQWSAHRVPWTGSDLVVLLALPDAVLAATHDPYRRVVSMWRSAGRGEDGWRRAAELPAARPVVAVTGDPPAVLAGRMCLTRNAAGRWARAAAPGGVVHRVAAHSDRLVAATDRGLALSTDRAAQWRTLEGLPPRLVLDIAITADSVYALLSGGHLWHQPL